MVRRPQKRVARSGRAASRIGRWVYAILGFSLVGSVLFLSLNERGHHLSTQIGDYVDALGQRAGLSLESLLVEGRHHLDRDQLQKTLGLNLKMAMTKVNVEDIQARLEKLPWVASAIVERRLPDQVVIRLKERRPLARWQHNGHVDILTTDGMVIKPVDEAAYHHLPLVVGKGANQAGEKLLMMLKHYPLVEEKVGCAVRVSDLRWDLHLKGGLIVRLPAERTEKALMKFEELMTQDQLKDKSLAVIDFRLPGRFIVQYKGKKKEV